MSENLYNILGVEEKATKDEIKKAYRGLQMKWHPDKNQGSDESKRMSEKINGAYEVLGDDEKRDEYDNSRNNPFARMNSQGGGGMEVPMDDIFNMFFGGMPGMGGFQECRAWAEWVVFQECLRVQRFTYLMVGLWDFNRLSQNPHLL